MHLTQRAVIEKQKSKMILHTKKINSKMSYLSIIILNISELNILSPQKTPKLLGRLKHYIAILCLQKKQFRFTDTRLRIKG
jgi:hypothetical protein